MQDGVDFLHAVREKDLKEVKDLIESGIPQPLMESGLCWASRIGSSDILSLLLDHGVNPDCEMWGGYSPLIWAAMFSENLECLELLIQTGCKINHSSYRRRQTALHAAVIRGSIEYTNFLLSAGADVDAEDSLNKTPLMWAVHKSQVLCVKSLILHNCNVNKPGHVNGELMTPVFLSLLQKDLEVAKLLIIAGAKFSVPAIYRTFTFKKYYKIIEDGLNFQMRPVYLQQQCRIQIRSVLKPKFMEKLKSMMLPHQLEQFLLISELDVI